jgi:hypothetical protein
MKKLLSITGMILIITVVSMAQDNGRDKSSGMFQHRGPTKKIEELEKIKLIDVLNLDEAASVKFFTRKNQSRGRVLDMENKISDLLNSIENEIKKGNSKDINKIQRLNEDYMNTSMEIEKERMNFIRSLNDILSQEQIGKLVVFEKRFREEIRELLLKERIRRNRNK